ncbi:MAG: PaaI family thioesterase [Actinomycetota bacterium]
MSDAEVDHHDDLPDRKASAAALNRLSHALVRHRADPRVLRVIAREADRLAAEIEREPVRERRMELLEHPDFEAALDGSLAELVHEDSAFVDAFSDSPVSGSANPLSIGLRIGRDGDEAVGKVTLAPGWQGAPGRSHGGVVAAIVDEVLGALLPMIGAMAFTGELTVRYTAPCPLGEELTFRARVAGHEGRKLYLECEGQDAGGVVFAEARSTFITIDLEQFKQT